MRSLPLAVRLADDVNSRKTGLYTQVLNLAC